MSLPTTQNPNLTLVPTSDAIASCNVCGAANYVRIVSGVRGDLEARFEPLGLALWDLRYSPNGFQWYVTKLCRGCLATVRALADAVLDADA